MRRIKLFGIIIVALGLFACAEDKSIGEIPELTAEYSLPQGHSSADDRIVEIFEKWGTYVLYDYETSDLEWLQVDVNNTWNSYGHSLPDTSYVDEMMDLLDKMWFRFYPDEFHQTFMPYKVFLASTLEYFDSYNNDTIAYNVRVVRNQMVVSNCNEKLTEMTETDKRDFKQDLQDALWGVWLSRFEIPEEFYDVSSYATVASANPDNWNYARTLGFIADEDGAEWSTLDPWPSTTLSENLDLNAYLSALRNRTEEEWAEDLTYPLVKQKYDILRNYFLENYHFDIQEIGNSTEF